MAYAALLSALQALKKATQQDQFYNLFTIKQQIKTLHEKLCFLQDFLENDPPACGEVIDCVEGRIREVAYRAEDIIELHGRNHVSRGEGCLVRPSANTGSWGTLVAVQWLFSLWKKHEKNKDVRAQTSELLYQDFQNVVDEVDSTVKEVVVIRESRKIEALQFSDHTTAEAAGSSRMAPSGETAVVGFDDDMIDLKNQLCGGSCNLQIISLVGMAGIGKTTLATNVFHDPLISYHFHVRAWTTITQDHKRPNIVQGLLHSMTTPSENLSLGLKQVDEVVYRSLKGRRYLIVLDDIWSTEAWDEVKMMFPDDHNGSRIIVTTRLVDVAVHTNSSGPFHQMQFLNQEQSWDLLQRKVFGEGCCCPPELEETGKWIARNCRGLPLSIIVVAGLLKINRIKQQWENIARDVSVAVTASDEHLPSKILSLSYNHLPHHLKPCFLSMGGFPEDYEIPVFKLITLWVAEGFLKPMGSKSLEEVAEVYLEDLVKRSLVLVIKKRSNQKPKSCSIHDLLRDLCIKKARDERFLHPMNGIQEKMEQKRRLWFSKSVEWFHFKNANTTTLLPARSVFCCSYNNRFITGFSHLKILHILEVNTESFPVETLHLLHLKFLAFTTGFIRYCALPPSLPKLQNLQTLIAGSSLRFGENEHRLVAPVPIWSMPKLRHLVFLNINLAPFPSSESPLLESLQLQTLTTVRNFRFTKEAIAMIPNLKKLKAIYSGDPCSLRQEYELDNLIHLHQLQTLNLNVVPSLRTQHAPVRFGVPLGIKKLTLRGCRLCWEDMRSVGCLPNLQVLKLLELSVVGEEWEMVEGELEFPVLRLLVMEKLDLRQWIAEAASFGRLEWLVIRHCFRLNAIPCGMGEIATLEIMEVDESSPSAAESAKRILEEQVSMGNDVLRVRIGADFITSCGEGESRNLDLGF